MHIPLTPALRAWLGLGAVAGAWLEHRFNVSAATWYCGLARALLGPSGAGNAEEMDRSYRWVRTEVTLLWAAGAALVISGVVALFI